MTNQGDSIGIQYWGLIGLLTLFLASAASAHHPTVDAVGVCDVDTGTLMIDYTSTAWAGEGLPGDRENAQIDILLDGVIADSGAYVAPTFSFSGTLAAPSDAQPGDSVVVTAFAADAWGNGEVGGQSRSVTVVLPPDDCGPVVGMGRFTGGGHQIRVDGVRVTRGLTIHCDLLLSNNLEINWNGNQFHMTEHMTTVTCSDDPLIIQAPPPAPLDTLVGVGVGRYNRSDNGAYTIEFTLVDAGEPGRDDEMAILVYETGNPANVVLSVPKQKLSGGNLQAHFDQPHK